MKAIKFFFLLFCCSIFAVNTATAQKKLNKVFNKALQAELMVYDKDKVFDTKASYDVKLPKRVLQDAIKLPVELRTPMKMYNGDLCLEVGCQAAPGGDCTSDCQMRWKDLNKDGRIQPERELRCMCKNNAKCGVTVREISCK